MAEDIVKVENMDKVVINHMPVLIRSVDRKMKDIGDWWEALQMAESVYFPNRAALYDILKTVELDGTLTGIIEKRIMNVTNKKMYFKKGENKIDACDELAETEAFNNLRRDRFIKLTFGLVGFEFIPGSEFKYNLIPLKHINPVLKKVTKDEWGTEGFTYEGVWNIIVRGERFDFGLLTKCAPYAIWKKGNMGDWAQYVEIFGQPLLIFTYKGYDEKTKQNIDEIMRNIGSGSRLILPEQLQLAPLDGKQSNGDGELQNKLRVACNEEMKLIVLTVTETSGSSQSSGYAQAKEHGEQQDELVKDDMKNELLFFNSKEFLAIQKSYGYPADGKWCYVEEQDLDKVTKKVTIVTNVKKLVPVDDDYIYEISGVPKPANYDAMKAQMEEERQVALNNHQQQQQPPKNKKPKSKDQLSEDDLTWLQRFRYGLADFFAPAPKE